MKRNSIGDAWKASWHNPGGVFISAPRSQHDEPTLPADAISNDEPQVPPTPTPSEEQEWSPVRPAPVAKETLLPNKGAASWARNNTRKASSTSTVNGDLDPLVLPPSGLRQRQRPPTRSTSSDQGLKRK